LFLTSPLGGGEWSPHALTITAEERAPIPPELEAGWAQHLLRR